MTERPVCVFHIGKTGGTFLRDVIEHNRTEQDSNIHFLGHQATLDSTAKTYGPDRLIAFVYRNPAARFVSGFQSRMNAGYPTYHSPWSTSEAVAFSLFETPEQLALALLSESPRDRAAAEFAVTSITHLARDYRYHFHSPARLSEEAENVVSCVALENLNAKLPDVMKAIGLRTAEIPKDVKRHVFAGTRKDLSDKARKNIRTFWQKEFEIVKVCRDLEKALTKN